MLFDDFPGQLKFEYCRYDWDFCDLCKLCFIGFASGESEAGFHDELFRSQAIRGRWVIMLSASEAVKI